jgi:hypothetical protein
MSTERMNPLKEGRHDPTLWLLAFVPVVFAAAKVKPEAHTLLFVLSVLAIMPLAALLSHATESVAAKTGDAAGGLLNATSAFSGAQEPAGPERGHLAGKRIPNRAVRGADAAAAQLRDRPDADGPATLAGRSGDGAHRHSHRLARH